VRFRDEYRDPQAAHRLAAAIRRTVTRPRTIMEVCGGQTHAIVRHGIDRLLEGAVTLLHGPGCPVCVTPQGYIDRAIALAAQGVVLCSYGDMLRVPGSAGDLLGAKARGAAVRMVYSPLDAVAIARALPDREVVFFAIGFETTAAPNAAAVLRARELGLRNFSLLACHVRVPPALYALLGQPGHRIEGFLAAGHVCTIMGTAEYEPIVARYGVPIVVTGFEPLDILDGILCCARQLESGRAELENAYARSVRSEGNRAAQALLQRVFTIGPRRWRGLGEVDAGGLALAAEFADLDAERRFGAVDDTDACEAAAGTRADAPADGEACISALVLRGLRKPVDCAAFGTRCTPEHPLGVTMVSGEGACAAYYRFRGPHLTAEAAS
jgi:hydrogenase expression/formation protein HypD